MRFFNQKMATVETGLLAALFCFLMLLAAPALAGSLRIAVPSLPPYGYLEGQQPTGLFFDLISAIAKRADFEPDNAILPPDRIVAAMASGKVEAAIMFPDLGIGSVAENLGEVLSMETVVLGRAGTVLRSRKDLPGKRLAMVRDSGCNGGLSKRDGIIPIPVTTYDQALKLLLASQVDGVIGPEPTLLFCAGRNNFPRQALGKPLVLARTDAHLFLSGKAATPEKRLRLRNALAGLQKDGTVAALMANYPL